MTRHALYRAICWANGRLEMAIGVDAPDGAVTIFTFLDGRAALVGQQTLSAMARHGRDGVLLVPGVPEADDDDQAMDALIAWSEWIYPAVRRRVPLSRFVPGRAFVDRAKRAMA